MGLVYVLVAEVSSPISAQVALALASGPAGEPLGVVFDARTGAEVSRYGPVLAAGAVSGGGRWRVWLTLRCVRQGQALVQLYALLSAHGLWQMTLRRPVVGMAVGPIPPAFVSTTEVGLLECDRSGARIDQVPVVRCCGQPWPQQCPARSAAHGERSR